MIKDLKIGWETKSERNLYLLVGGICFFFAAFFIYPELKKERDELDNMREVSITDEVERTYISHEKTQRPDRGAILVNDSLYLWKIYPNCNSVDKIQINNLGDIKAPYEISKSTNSPYIIVYKDDLEYQFCPFE